MNKVNQKALEAAVAHGFRKNDFNSVGQALLGEFEQRSHVQEEIKQQVTSITQNVNELNVLKTALAGDENGVLRIQTLYVG